MRRLFLTSCGLCAASLVGVVAAKMTPFIGPEIELKVAPIVMHDVSRDSVVRTADNRLCWRVHLAKLRDAMPWNLDVFLDRPWSHDRSFPEIRDRWTREPLHTASALHADQTRDQDQCVDLPSDLRPGEPLTLSETVHYPGYRGWWDVPVELFSILYTIPGEPAHDQAPTPPSAPTDLPSP